MRASTSFPTPVSPSRRRGAGCAAAPSCLSRFSTAITALYPSLTSSSSISDLATNVPKGGTAANESAPATHQKLDAELRTPSIYDEAIKLLVRQGLHIDADRLAADWTLPTSANASVKAAWLTVYQDPTRYWALYELAVNTQGRKYATGGFTLTVTSGAKAKSSAACRRR